MRALLGPCAAILHVHLKRDATLALSSEDLASGAQRVYRSPQQCTFLVHSAAQCIDRLFHAHLGGFNKHSIKI